MTNLISTYFWIGFLQDFAFFNFTLHLYSNYLHISIRRGLNLL